MTIEQLERRLKALELSTRGSDYVRLMDDKDALEDAEKKEALDEETSPPA